MKYSIEDERLLEEAWGRLSISCEKICRKDGDREMIQQAYVLAKEAHEGVRRRTGDPYLAHPIAVAQIVVDEIGLGVKSVVAALLHDVVEDTHYTLSEIEALFGAKVASMVDGLTKISGVFNREVPQRTEYLRKMLLTLCDDVRVILIKIADRLHNMRTLGVMPLEKQIKVTSETIYLFAPLAHRLGLYSIKSELEDLCLKYQFPAEYGRITNKISQTQEQRDRLIELFTAPIIEGLDTMGVKYEIAGRVKSPYSIWNKMQRKGVDFEEIYDLFAIRIVFQPDAKSSEKSQCWQIYSLITDYYTPNTDRLRDWVSIPKNNGYEALHVTVMGKNGEWVEVQIRTKRMDEIAERGFAAHWKYKQIGTKYEDDEFDKWLGKVRTVLCDAANENSSDLLDDFKLSLYTSDIVVFTPTGEQRKLPINSTAIDFAYDIHSKIGNRAIGAKINHKVKSITSKIKSGDQIEIITSENARPSAEWLDVVVTSKATTAIKSFLKSERENNIERGKKLFEERMEELQTPISGRVIRKVLPAYESANKEEFYSKVGSGIVSLDNLSQVLKRNTELKILKFWNLFIDRTKDVDDIETDALDDGLELSLAEDRDEFVIAECCMPIPGDDVVGYRDPSNGDIIVHKSTCKELCRLMMHSDHNIVKEDISWLHQKSLFFLTRLSIKGFDRVGLLRDLAQVVSSDFNINIREINISSHDGIFEGTFALYVYDSQSLSNVIKKIRSIRGFESVKRQEF